MARRKSFTAEILDALRKSKEARERAERQAQKEYQQALRKQREEADRLRRDMARREEREHLAAIRAREAADAKRAKEAARFRQERERLLTQEKREQDRLAAQAEKDRQRRVAELERERARKAAQEEREFRQRAAQVSREQAHRKVEQRQAEAATMTTELETRLEEFDQLLSERNRNLAPRQARLQSAFDAEGSLAFVDQIHAALATSVYPSSLNGGSKAGYYPESRELRVEYELPRLDVVPRVASYKYVKASDEIRATDRKDAEVKRSYGRLLASVSLRVMAEIFDLCPAPLVQNVVFNGHVSAKDRATGRPIHPCLISVYAAREQFEELVLDEPELDPVRTLGYLNAVVSPHPYDLESVRPVAEFDLSKYKFVEEMDVVAGMDSRTDLLTLKPVEFEQLVRQLFEAIGLKSWVTQGSRDDGVDAVAVNEDPIMGGICVVQAKRYKNIVGVEAVNALSGVMNDKAAARGILVTTSWFGKASYDFAARTGRMQLIDGRELKSMLEEHLGLRVLIGLPKLPPGWETRDLS